MDLGWQPRWCQSAWLPPCILLANMSPVASTSCLFPFSPRVSVASSAAREGRSLAFHDGVYLVPAAPLVAQEIGWDIS